MSACERCWSQASRWAAYTGGSVADHYRELLARNSHHEDELPILVEHGDEA